MITPQTAEQINTSQTDKVETIAGIPAEKVHDIIETRKATAEANRTPFPGPLREAFSVAPELKLGKYVIRPFFDGDFDVLQTLNHPLAKMVFGEDEDWSKDYKIIRGQKAWNLCYLMTTPAEEIGKLLEEPKGLELFQKKAKAEFSMKQLGDLAALQTLIVKQFNLYFAPVIGFEAAEEEGAKKKLS